MTARTKARSCYPLDIWPGVCSGLLCCGCIKGRTLGQVHQMSPASACSHACQGQQGSGEHTQTYRRTDGLLGTGKKGLIMSVCVRAGADPADGGGGGDGHLRRGGPGPGLSCGGGPAVAPRAAAGGQPPAGHRHQPRRQEEPGRGPFR